jgi:ferric-dicitrate binding protein FerR (iron transport regulator)
MSDELLKELARVARERREEESREARWEGLAQGTLSEEERRELERLAGETPEAHAAYEAFRPLEPEARERIVARLEQEGTGAKVVPLASRRRVMARVVVPAALAAMAAGVLLVVLPVGGGAPVPEYALSFSGEQAVRSDAPEAEVVRLGPGSRFTLVLRPEQGVEGKVEARAFLVRPGEARAWSVPMEVSAEGAVRIQGRAEELPVPPGEWTLAIAVGRPGALPDAPGEVRSLVEARRAPDSDAWRLLTRKLLLAPPP